jgi:hypothetical protein
MLAYCDFCAGKRTVNEARTCKFVEAQTAHISNAPKSNSDAWKPLTSFNSAVWTVALHELLPEK